MEKEKRENMFVLFKEICLNGIGEKEKAHFYIS